VGFETAIGKYHGVHDDFVAMEFDLAGNHRQWSLWENPESLRLAIVSMASASRRRNSPNALNEQDWTKSANPLLSM
jgi:hypothetical protein